MIYVLSDIHGNERRFDSVLEQIRLQPEDTLYILGDVIDRYGGGVRLLRRIIAMPNAKMLLGNHEYMMLRALGQPYDDNRDDGRALAHWYRNGGDVTHRSWKHTRKAVRKGILDYLHGLPLSFDIRVNGTDYKLVHGAPIETYASDPKYRNPIHYAVWKRLDAAEKPLQGHTVVFGHTPTQYYQDKSPMEVWWDGNRIGIDCGSGFPEEGHGRLACLRLDDEKVFYSVEKGLPAEEEMC